MHTEAISSVERENGRFRQNVKKTRIVTGFAFVKSATIAAPDEVGFLGTLKVILPKIVARRVGVCRRDLRQLCGSSIAPMRIQLGIGCRGNRFGGDCWSFWSRFRTSVRFWFGVCRIQRDDLWKRLEIEFRIELISNEWSDAVRADAIRDWGSPDNRHEKRDSENEKGRHVRCI